MPARVIPNILAFCCARAKLEPPSGRLADVGPSQAGPVLVAVSHMSGCIIRRIVLECMFGQRKAFQLSLPGYEPALTQNPHPEASTNTRSFIGCQALPPKV